MSNTAKEKVDHREWLPASYFQAVPVREDDGSISIVVHNPIVKEKWDYENGGYRPLLYRGSTSGELRVGFRVEVPDLTDLEQTKGVQARAAHFGIDVKASQLGVEEGDTLQDIQNLVAKGIKFYGVKRHKAGDLVGVSASKSPTYTTDGQHYTRWRLI